MLRVFSRSIWCCVSGFADGPAAAVLITLTMNSAALSFVAASSILERAKATLPPAAFSSFAICPPADLPRTSRPLAKSWRSGSDGSGGASAPEPIGSESFCWLIWLKVKGCSGPAVALLELCLVSALALPPFWPAFARAS